MILASAGLPKQQQGQQPDIDGALVGGASLKADDFLGIISVYR